MSMNDLFGPWETLKFAFLKDAPCGKRVGVLTINRPEKYNALNERVLSELKNFLTLAQNDSLGALIVTGEGEKAFIAGADIGEMSDMDSIQARLFGLLGQEVTFLFEKLACPVIAAVNGHALGGGCEMAMSMDLILASENATFGQPEVKIGLIPGFGGTQRLARIIGRHRAKELVYTGRSLKAREALEWGLVLKVYPDRLTLMAEAEKLAYSILLNSPKAVSLAKEVMIKANDWDLPRSLTAELDMFEKIFTSKDREEGTRAFVEKRPAKFTGE